MSRLLSWFGLGKRRRPLVGVDVGSAAVKVVSLKPAGKGYQVEALGSEPFPADTIVDGAIISKVPVAEAISRVFETHGIRNQKIATSISGHSVIVKKLTLPVQSNQELSDSIQWEAEQYIPFDISDVNLDYQVTGKSPEGSKVEVILVAAKRDKITDHTAVISMAGKIPMVVDIDAFALQNAYEVNYFPEETRVAALLNIGSSIMNISIVKGTEFLYTRDISIGGHHYTDFLQKELNISFEEAEELKRGGAVSPELSEKAVPILDSVTEMLALEVQKTFDYFRTTPHSVDIQTIYLSGGASRTPGLQEFLHAKFRIPVEFLNPFKRVRVDGSLLPPDRLQEMAAEFVVAVGLALRTAQSR